MRTFQLELDEHQCKLIRMALEALEKSGTLDNDEGPGVFYEFETVDAAVLGDQFETMLQEGS